MKRWTSRDESGYYHLRYVNGVEPTKKDLIQRVGQFEDTGLEPEEIDELKNALKDLRREVDEILNDQKFVQVLKDRGIDVDAGIRHMEELLQAEQDGRLVVLPCKVGDTVYGIKPLKKEDGFLTYEMKHGAVLAFKALENGAFCVVSAEEQFGYPVAWRLYDFGKTVFLTRAEAEAALKGGEG